MRVTEIDPIIDYTAGNTGVFVPDQPTNLAFNGDPLPVAILPTPIVTPATAAAASEFETLSPKIVTAAPVQYVNQPASSTTSDVVAAMPISVKVIVVGDNSQPLALTNIAINGVATAKTSTDGTAILPNVKSTDDITFSYVGYQSQTFKAGAIPTPVLMKTTAIILPEVTITPKPTNAVQQEQQPKPAKKSNGLLWLSLLGLGLGVAALSSKEKPKKESLRSPVVIAKI